MNPTPAPYRFHAFEVSYFSAKVRCALRYKQLWVDEVRADFREIIQRTGLAFIPMVITPEGETWQDSTDIYDQLEVRHPDPPLFPRTAVQRIASHLVELYVDEVALIPAMHYRWGSPEGEASARSRFVAMTGSAERGKQAGDQMVKARIAVGAVPEAAPAIEAHTRELLDALSAHFEVHPYLLGARQSFADCALMGPLYAHLFNDHDSRELLLQTAAPVVGWIERCNYPGTDTQGEWLADDAIAPTLTEVLRVMGRDGAGVILASARAGDDWAEANPDARSEPPRVAGRVEPEFHGAKVPRVAQMYTSWMVQRTLEAVGSLDAAERQRVDAALAGTGWEEVLDYEPRHRLAKHGFALAFE